MSLFLLSLAIVGLFCLLQISQKKLLEPAPLILPFSFLAYLIPALFFLYWTTLGAPDAATRLRVAQLGIGFVSTENNVVRELGTGRHPDDALLVKQFSKAQSEKQPAFAGAIHLHTGSKNTNVGLYPPALPAQGVMAVSATNEVYKTPNTLGLHHGDVVKYQQQQWTLELTDSWPGRPDIKFVNGLKYKTLNKRETEVAIIGLKLSAYRERGLNNISYPVNSILGIRTSQLLGVFHHGKDTSGNYQLYLSRFDARLSIVREGKTLTFPEFLPLRSGQHIYALGIPNNWSIARQTARPMRDFRSFRVITGKQSVAFDFDTKDQYTLTLNELHDLRLPYSGNSQQTPPIRVALATGDWYLTQQFIHLPQASRKIAQESFAILDFPGEWEQSWGDLGQGIPLSSPNGHFNVYDGQPFWLGKQNLTAIQLDLLNLPTRLAWLTLFLVIIKTGLAVQARMSGLQILLAASLECLVLFRLLLGYRTWAFPPFAAESFQWALIAWAMIPWGYLYLSQRLQRPKRGSIFASLGGWFVQLTGLLFSAIWCWQIAGGGTGFKALLWPLLHLAILPLPWLYPQAFANHQRKSAIFDLSRWFPIQRKLVFWLVLATLFMCLRLGLVFFGFKEAIYIGTRIPLTVLHIPLALAIQAGYLYYLHKQKQDASIQWRDGFGFIWLVCCLWLIPGFTASDLGLILLNLPVFILCYLMVLLRSVASGSRQAYQNNNKTWVAKFQIFLAVIPMVVIFLPVVITSLVPNSIHERLIFERNYIRYLLAGDAAEAKNIASSASDDLIEMDNVMKAYTHNNFWGHGYTNSELHHTIKATALAEHTTTVFIAAEWGVVGVCGLALIYILIGWLGWQQLPWSLDSQRASQSSPWLQGLACWSGLLLLTFSLASVYMILANYGLVPFTGKNLYLFGLNSGSDIIESALILFLSASAFQALRNRERL